MCKYRLAGIADIKNDQMYWMNGDVVDSQAMGVQLPSTHWESKSGATAVLESIRDLEITIYY